MVPNLIDRFPQGNATPGTVKAAGLPNISGYQNFARYAVLGGNYGAFVEETKSQSESTLMNLDHSSATEMFMSVSFDASRSNSIYGNSSTVQPPALTLVPIIKSIY